MGQTARLLYYDLGMYADDEGIAEAFTVMRMTGASEDDLNAALTKVIPSEQIPYVLKIFKKFVEKLPANPAAEKKCRKLPRYSCCACGRLICR